MDAARAKELVYRSGEYFETQDGTLVSKEAVILGEENIFHVDGRLLVCPRAVLRGDAARISIGANVVVRSDVVVRPSPPAASGPKGASVPMTIGNFVMVEEGAVLFAKSIGNYVRVGEGAVLGRGCIIEDCVDIMPGAEIPAGAIVPAFTRVASPSQGAVAVHVADLLPCWRQCRAFDIDEIFNAIRKVSLRPPPSSSAATVTESSPQSSSVTTSTETSTASDSSSSSTA